ncbi:MAG TPA: DNA-binding domain-containing protein, partial [Roseiflexaceae bacterium]|nr:DNA-binding domain-containing protein [Roseiflexaceae bacterium]
MASLRETQRAFANAVLFDDPSRITDLLCGGAFTPLERIGIYRNNSRLGFLATMEAIFPVVRQLGGDAWFASIVRRYQQRHPSRSGNLHHIGERFAEFLADELDAALGYFADVAALEWAYQEVLVAADVPVL